MPDGSFVGQAWIQVSPSLTGFQDAISKQLNGIGKTMGAQMGSQMSAATASSFDGRSLSSKALSVGGDVGSSLVKGIGTLNLDVLKGVGDTLSGIAKVGATAFGTLTGAAVSYAAANTQTYVRGVQFAQALDLVAQNAGVSNAVVQDQINRMVALGASTGTARDTMMAFIRSGLDATQAYTLYARAEDLAVTTGQTGNEVQQELLQGIQTGRTEVLRSAGVIVDANQAYANYAASIGTTADQLTGAQKQQALFNQVMTNTANIAGVAQRMMQGGVFNWAALAAPMSNLAGIMGSLLEPATTTVGRALFNLINAFTSAARQGGALYPVVEAIRTAVANLSAPLGTVINAVTNWIKGLGASGGAISTLSSSIVGLAGPITAVLTGFTAFAGIDLTKSMKIPLLSTWFEHLSSTTVAVIAGFAALLVTSPQVQASLGGLFSAIGPLISQLGQTFAPIIANLQFALGSAVAAIMPGITALIRALGPVITSIGQALGSAVIALAPALVQLGQAIGQVFAGIAPLLPSIGQLVSAIIRLAVNAIAPLLPVAIQLLQSFIAPLYRAVAPLIPLITQLVQQFGGYLVQGFAALIPAVQAVIPSIVQIFQILGQAAAQILPVLAPILAQVGQLFVALMTALAPLLPTIAQVVVLLLRLAVSVLVPLIPALAPIISAFLQLATAILPIVVQFIGLLLQVLMPLLPIITTIVTSALQPMMAVLGPLLTILLTLVSGVLKVLQPIIAPLAVAIGVLAAAWFLWNVALDANPLILIGMAIVGVIAALWNICKPLAIAILAVAAAVVIWNVAMWLLDANPIVFIITTIILAIIALVAAIVWLVENFDTVANAIASAATWLWSNVLQPVFNAIWSAFQFVGQMFVWVWQNLIYPIWQTIYSVAMWLWNNVLSPIFNAIWSAFQFMGSMISWVWNNVILPVWNTVASVASWLWNTILSPIFSAIQWAWNTMASGLSWIYWNIIHPIWGFFTQAIQALKTTFDTVVSGIKTVWDGLAKTVGTPIYGAIKYAVRPFVDAINWVLSKIHLGFNPDWSWVESIPHWAKGGPVPGHGRGDKVVGMLEPGEWVLTRRQAQAIGYTNLRNLPHYATGGYVGEGHGGPSPRFNWNPLHYVGAAVSAIGGAFESGWNALQKLRDTIWNLATGLIREVAYDAVKGMLSPLRDTLAKYATGSEANGRWFDGIIGKVGVWVIDQFLNWLGGRVEKADAGGTYSQAVGYAGGGAAQWASTVVQALQMLGQPTSQNVVNAVLNIIQSESGGNPNAINLWDSNAKAGHPSQGLMQTIPGTFAAYRLPGTSTNILDPLANIVAGINYAIHQYGSIFNVPGIRALASGRGYVGYDEGGFLPPGASIAINDTGRPEPVLTPQQWRDLQVAADNSDELTQGQIVDLLRRIAEGVEQGRSVMINGREVARVVDREMAYLQ